MKLHRGLMKAAAAACVIAGLGSAAASASTPANFSPATGAVRESNTTALSWYADGVLVGSCVPSLQGASYLQHSLHAITGTVGTCNNGSQAPLWFQLQQSAINDSGSFSLSWHAGFIGFPGYTVNNANFSTPWTNGSALTGPSKVTFNNTVVGTSTNGHVMSISGVLNVTNLDGSLLTLS